MKVNLKRWRKARVLSIKMLAERADVSPATIVNIEQNKHTPNPDTLHRLAKALNVSVEQLIEDEEMPVSTVA